MDARKLIDVAPKYPARGKDYPNSRKKKPAPKGSFIGLSRIEYERIYRENNPEQQLLGSARNRARRKGVPFAITLDDIVIPESCPILGIKLVRHLGQPGGKEDSPSIDRIDPAKGYVPGNVHVISMLANNMKQHGTPEQLKMFAKWVLDNG